jgi:hypothetical protein
VPGSTLVKQVGRLPSNGHLRCRIEEHLRALIDFSDFLGCVQQYHSVIDQVEGALHEVAVGESALKTVKREHRLAD